MSFGAVGFLVSIIVVIVQAARERPSGGCGVIFAATMLGLLIDMARD